MEDRGAHRVGGHGLEQKTLVDVDKVAVVHPVGAAAAPRGDHEPGGTGAGEGAGAPVALDAAGSVSGVAFGGGSGGGGMPLTPAEVGLALGAGLLDPCGNGDSLGADQEEGKDKPPPLDVGHARQQHPIGDSSSTSTDHSVCGWCLLISGLLLPLPITDHQYQYAI